MSFLAGVLLLNVEAEDAFRLLANLLNRPCMRSFITVNIDRVGFQRFVKVSSKRSCRRPFLQMTLYHKAFDVLLEEQMPALAAHLRDNMLSPDLYLTGWSVICCTRKMRMQVCPAC
eukprot:m.248870 g.248870  ORF g.248870 m.248870 type:complete len:116 (+) comp10973_c0_seq39:988-1335(+)